MKKLLVVIKDNVELKNFLMYKFNEYINKKDFELYVISPVNNDPLFQEEIQKYFNNIIFLDANIFSKVLFIDKGIYFTKRLFFYLINLSKSDSCFQKFMINLGYKNIIKSNNYNLIKKIIIPISFLSTFLKKRVSKHKFYFSKVNSLSNINFDYVFFLRTDSLVNAVIYNSIKKNKKLKVISMIRNFDSPILKGVFTIPSDITLCSNKVSKNLLKQVNNRYNYGRILLLKPLKIESTVNYKRLNIMYATGSPSLDPLEYKKVSYLYDKLSRKLKGDFNFYIKVHGNDQVKNYVKLKDNKNVIIQSVDKKQTQYISYNGKKHNFFDLDRSIEHYNDLSKCTLVMSSFSTINYDAYLANTKSCFFDLEGFTINKHLYKREHIKEISYNFDIPIIKSIEELLLLLEQKT